MRTNRLRAVLFDFDGVLADTVGLVGDAACAALRPLGLVLGEAAYTRRFYGLGGAAWRDEISRLLEEHGLTATDAVLWHIQDHISHHAVAGTQAVNGMLDTWNAVQVARAIVSSCPRTELIAKVLRLGLRRRSIQALVGGEDAARPKPFPDLYATALERLRLSPAQGVAIEDSPQGIEAAAAAGLATILFTGTHARLAWDPTAAPMHCAPDFVARDAAELRHLLQRLGACGAGLPTDR